MDDLISDQLEKHCSETFQRYGATPAGVDWGFKTDKITRRYKAFVNQMPQEPGLSILDVGCGYGEIIRYLDRTLDSYTYTGIDPSAVMIDHARGNHGINASFHNQTLFDYARTNPEPVDCVICCGLFTLKLDANNPEMALFLMNSLKLLFPLTKKRLIFNVMSTHSNYFAPNLFYQSPVELLSRLLDNFSKKIVIDHASVEYECLIRIER
jgi:SAM-dependent methyltransferase